MLSVCLVVTTCLVSQHFFTLPGRHCFHAGKPRPGSCSPWEVSGAGLSPEYIPLCLSVPQGSTSWASRGSLAHSHFLGSGSWGHRLSKKGPGAPGGAVAPPAMCQPWGWAGLGSVVPGPERGSSLKKKGWHHSHWESCPVAGKQLGVEGTSPCSSVIMDAATATAAGLVGTPRVSKGVCASCAPSGCLWLHARSEGPDQLLPREFSPAEQQAPGRDTSATGNLLCPGTHNLSATTAGWDRLCTHLEALFLPWSLSQGPRSAK